MSEDSVEDQTEDTLSGQTSGRQALPVPGHFDAGHRETLAAAYGGAGFVRSAARLLVVLDCPPLTRRLPST